MWNIPIGWNADSVGAENEPGLCVLIAIRNGVNLITPTIGWINVGDGEMEDLLPVRLLSVDAWHWLRAERQSFRTLGMKEALI